VTDADANQDYDFAINVPVLINWTNVSLLVTSVQNCFNAMFANVTGSRTVAIVTAELLENAIKYGAWEQADQRLRLAVSGSSAVTRVTVENPATNERFEELQKSLDWMASFPDAKAAFQARLLSLATTSDPEVSRLGVVRIAYEGGCSLAATFVNGVVRVTAEMKR
jgi:hypothetical protein